MSTSLPVGSLPRETARSEKLMPPMTLPSVGMNISPTSEETIFPEGRADDHADRQVDDIALHRKFFEFCT